jgi:5-formyltetrahydrofolate cyclo-ligase
MDAAHTAEAEELSGMSGAESASKRELRAVRLSERKAVPPQVLADASSRICARLTDLPELDRPGALALFQPLGFEIDLLDLWRGLRTARPVVFPRVIKGTRVLAFAELPDEAHLGAGVLGIREPPAAHDVPLESISVFIVPALAFDVRGYRLGRGGGYYDATLAAAPAAVRIGVGLDGEVVPALPFETHDMQLDLVVTPTHTLRTRYPAAP